MGGWLAGLDAFVVGAAYLVALLATRFVVRPLLVSVLGSAPVVGGWLSSNVDQGLAAFERNITPAAEASMGTLVSAWDWATGQVRGVLGGLGDYAEATYASLWHITAVRLPRLADQVIQEAEALVADARGYALGLFQAAESDASLLLGKAEADAAALVSATEATLRSEINAAEGIVLQEIRKAEQATGDLFLQAERDAGQLVDASESTLAGLVAQARADLGGAIGAVEHDLQQLARAERVALEDSVSLLGGDLAAAEARASEALKTAESNLGQTIDQILKSGPWGALVAAYQGGEAALAADVETLVRLSLKQLRQEMANVEGLRARFTPQIEAAFSILQEK